MVLKKYPNMDGGCLAIWRKEALSISEKNRLWKYSVRINKISEAFSIRIDNPEPVKANIKEKVIKVFDGLPREEITICGFSEFLFLATEEILKNYGGYLKIGIGETKKAILAIEGEAIELFDRNMVSLSLEDPGLLLVDQVFVKNYFNTKPNPEIREICKLDNYL